MATTAGQCTQALLSVSLQKGSAEMFRKSGLVVSREQGVSYEMGMNVPVLADLEWGPIAPFRRGVCCEIMGDAFWWLRNNGCSFASLFSPVSWFTIVQSSVLCKYCSCLTCMRGSACGTKVAAPPIQC